MIPNRLRTRVLRLSLLAVAFFGVPAVAQDSPATMFGGNVIMPTAGDLDVWQARGGGRAPTLIFFQDLEWAGFQDCEIGDVFRELNDAGISVVNLFLQGRDLVDVDRLLNRALRRVRDHATWHRLNLERIVVAGCGSGAHLAALLGSDARYFERAGLNFGSLRGVVAVGSMGFDLQQYVARVRQTLPERAARRALRYFGDDREMLRRLSPSTHIAPPNAPSFIFLEPPPEPGRLIPSEDFAAQLAAFPNVVVERRYIAELATPQRESRLRSQGAADNAFVFFVVPLLTSEQSRR